VVGVRDERAGAREDLAPGRRAVGRDLDGEAVARGLNPHADALDVERRARRRRNAGGPAVSPYVADVDFVAGSTIDHANTIDTSGVSNPAPAAVYQSARIGNFTYTIPGFAAGSSHTVRLHFCETYFSTTGSRVFDVSINGAAVLTNFDILAASGAQNKAIVESFTVPANGSGQYVVQFTSVANNSLVSALQVQ
jgi:hypothetical protein